MPRTRALQASRQFARATRHMHGISRRTASCSAAAQSRPAPAPVPASLPRYPFSTCSARRYAAAHGSTDAPPSKLSHAEAEAAGTAGELDIEQYHRLADEWLDKTLTRFEDLQDQGEEIDVEFSSGVMTIRVADKGTYVLNKQPPNKQIWLSSPISGPKRYDWSGAGSSQAEAGRWVYARDNSTLDQLILEELGVDLSES